SSPLPRATGIGGVTAVPSIVSRVACTSTSPVASSGFFMLAGRAVTSPSTSITVSLASPAATRRTSSGPPAPTATRTGPARPRRHQSGAAAQRLHVGPGRRFGAGEQEKQPHRFPVNRFIWDGGRRRAGHDDQGPEHGRLAVRHRHAVPDSGRELLLALEDSAQ